MDEETVKRLIAQRRVMAQVQKFCDDQNLPYPAELCAYLMDTWKYRNAAQ